MDLLDHQMVDDSDSDSDVAVSPSGSSMLGKKSINRGRWTKEEVSFHSVFKHGHTVYAEDLSTLYPSSILSGNRKIFIYKRPWKGFDPKF